MYEWLKVYIKLNQHLKKAKANIVMKAGIWW